MLALTNPPAAQYHVKFCEGFSGPRVILLQPTLSLMAHETPPDPLSSTLAHWHVQPPRDPQFRAQVWSRLEQLRRPSNWPEFARTHARALGGALAIALVIGAWAGREQARARVDEDRAMIASAYVQGMDARLMQLP